MQRSTEINILRRQENVIRAMKAGENFVAHFHLFNWLTALKTLFDKNDCSKSLRCMSRWFNGRVPGKKRLPGNVVAIKIDLP